MPTILRAGIRGWLLRAAGGDVLCTAGSVLRTCRASEGVVPSPVQALALQMGLLVIPTFQPGCHETGWWQPG